VQYTVLTSRAILRTVLEVYGVGKVGQDSLISALEDLNEEHPKPLVRTQIEKLQLLHRLCQEHIELLETTVEPLVFLQSQIRFVLFEPCLL
jgi:hypothetical protein